MTTSTSERSDLRLKPRYPRILRMLQKRRDVLRQESRDGYYE